VLARQHTGGMYTRKSRVLAATDITVSDVELAREALAEMDAKQPKTATEAMIIERAASEVKLLVDWLVVPENHALALRLARGEQPAPVTLTEVLVQEAREAVEPPAELDAEEPSWSMEIASGAATFIPPRAIDPSKMDAPFPPEPGYGEAT